MGSAPIAASHCSVVAPRGHSTLQLASAPGYVATGRLHLQSASGLSASPLPQGTVTQGGPRPTPSSLEGPPYLCCLLAPFSAPSPSSERGRRPPPPPSTSAVRGDAAPHTPLSRRPTQRVKRTDDKRLRARNHRKSGFLPLMSLGSQERLPAAYESRECSLRSPRPLSRRPAQKVKRTDDKRFRARIHSKSGFLMLMSLGSVVCSPPGPSQGVPRSR
ncbi:hypothetical protein NDU88_004437 [Pleurodeles waltl]|uniref:Uncharacterized protein n=1 Tax=Pleurodeles waltl TaxID=8319 RepID=A0AAV7MGM3_PLEWA|nr:hypothetical protein NDU88_004437 [Pleurodeles waltl]